MKYKRKPKPFSHLLAVVSFIFLSCFAIFYLIFSFFLFIYNLIIFK